MGAKEVIATLAGQGVKVQVGLVYLIKSKMGRTRRRKARVARQQAAASNGHVDPVVLVTKIRKVADEIGGMNKLKALLEAMSG